MIVRKHVRIEVRIMARFRVDGDRRDTVYRGTTKNLSRGGVCILVEERRDEVARLFAGRKPPLLVSLYLARSKPLVEVASRTAWISSRVGWLETPGDGSHPVLVGASFEHLPEVDARKIDCFIEELIRADGQSMSAISARLQSRLRAMPNRRP